jgi:hypothetical protein
MNARRNTSPLPGDVSPEGRDVAQWLETDPRAAIAAAAKAAMRLIPGHLGTCVACVLEDHGADREPNPNIHELAYTLLRYRRVLDCPPLGREPPLEETLRVADEQIERWREALDKLSGRDAKYDSTCEHCGMTQETIRYDPASTEG